MAELDKELAAYNAMRAQLEKDHMGEWILVHDGELVGAFRFSEAAAEEAVRRFGRGPYLIRQVGAPPVILPASVLYHPT